MASTNDAYEVLELIGHGAFGQIRKVRRRSDGLILVRKEISYVRMSEKEKSQLVAEFEILARLKHQNIVEYFHRDHMKKEQSIHLYMEYCGNGDLSTIIKRCKAERTMVPEQYIWSIFTQVLQALYRCHNGVNPPDLGEFFSKDKQGMSQTTGDIVRILHRDLKPENIFLDMDNAVKLGDFGLSKMLAPEQHLASTYVGTPYYMSPELISEDNYTHKSDIWALGCIVYELCKLAPPFNAQNLHSLGNRIKEGRYTPIPNQYSPELGRMIDLCLQRDPAKRPDTAQLLQMPYVKLHRRELEVFEVARSFKRREEELRTKAESLKMKEDELRQKDAHFSMEQELARKAIQERCDELHNELRHEWEVKAQAEIERRVALQLEQFQKREVEAQSKWQEEVEAMARRMVEQMDLVPRSSAAAILSYSTGNDSAYAASIASASIASASIASIAESPLRPRARTMIPESPADIDMGSPTVFDPSPRKNHFGNLCDQTPPRMPLTDMLPPPNQLRSQSAQQNPLSIQGISKFTFKLPNRIPSTSQNGLVDSLALERSSEALGEDIPSPTKRRTGLSRASTFTGFASGSPMRGIGRSTGVTSTSTPKILFGAVNSLGGKETIVKTTPINSKALSLVQIAQQNPDWADEIPSPFLKRNQRRI